MSFPKSMESILSTKKALEKFLYFLKAICFVDNSLSFDSAILPIVAGILPRSLP